MNEHDRTHVINRALAQGELTGSDADLEMVRRAEVIVYQGFDGDDRGQTWGLYQLVLSTGDRRMRVFGGGRIETFVDHD